MNKTISYNLQLPRAWRTNLPFGVTGNANRARENERTFTVNRQVQFPAPGVEHARPSHRDCGIATDTSTWGRITFIPIAGQIGVYKTVYTFFQMTIFEWFWLPSLDRPPVPSRNGRQTDLHHGPRPSVTPKVVFAQAGARFPGLLDGSGTGLARRRDTHQGHVGLALEPTGPVALDSLRGFVFSGAGISETPLAAGRRRGKGLVVVGNA